jgi:ATP-dependent RNA helicase DeaD
MELTRAAVREAIVEGQFDEFRAVVESLAEEFDVMDVAMAAVKLAHQASGGPAGGDEAEDEILAVEAPPAERPGKKSGKHKAGKGERPRGREGGGRDMARLFVGLGRHAGIRPQDLVGAIAGEAGIDGGEVGGIEIADRFSVVEVPAARAKQVIQALKATKIRGRKVMVRFDREGR